MTARRQFVIGAFAAAVSRRVLGQVIEYESNGIKYQTATRRGLTVIVSHLPNHIAGFGLIQVAVSNGSSLYWTVKPDAFSYVRPDGQSSATGADAVVDLLLDRASHADVVKLVTSYESSLYAIPNMRSANNGYEQRRQSALTYGMPARLKAAATASALVLGQTRLPPGESTDGAVFIPLNHEMKALTGGRIVFHCESETFEFNPD